MGCGFFRQAYEELRVSDSIGFKIERRSTCPTGGKFRTWPCTAITNAMCQKPTNPWANAKDATVIPAAQPCEARLSDVCGRLKA